MGFKKSLMRVERAFAARPQSIGSASAIAKRFSVEVSRVCDRFIACGAHRYSRVAQPQRRRSASGLSECGVGLKVTE
jgi:hypothetical protein